MPCYDSRPTHCSGATEAIKELKDIIKQRDALLCGLCKAVGDDLARYIGKVNWTDVGMHRDDFFAWHRLHMRMDKEGYYENKRRKSTIKTVSAQIV